MRHSLLLLALLAFPPAAPASPATDARKAARGAGFAAIAGRVARAAEPTFMLDRTILGSAPARLGTSRIGGDPDVSPGTAWPRCKRRPQSFLVQIRLADLPRSARDLRRLGGHLVVFTDVEFEPGETEIGLWGGACTEVVHVRRGAALRRARPPKDGTVMRLRPARLDFRKRTDVPDTNTDDSLRLGPPLRDILLPDMAASNRWTSMRDGLRGRSRLEHRLLGYVDAPNGGEACYQRTQRARAPWRHLITIGYDEGVGFEVADAGRLQVAISPTDLRRGRLNRACGIFDSG